MSHEDGESLIDRVRHAFGRDADDDPNKVVNRPAGPDYAAEEPVDPALARADTTHDFDGVEVTTDERAVVGEGADERLRRDDPLDDPF